MPPHFAQTACIARMTLDITTAVERAGQYYFSSGAVLLGYYFYGRSARFGISRDDETCVIPFRQGGLRTRRAH